MSQPRCSSSIARSNPAMNLSGGSEAKPTCSSTRVTLTSPIIQVVTQFPSAWRVHAPQLRNACIAPDHLTRQGAFLIVFAGPSCIRGLSSRDSDNPAELVVSLAPHQSGGFVLAVD